MARHWPERTPLEAVRSKTNWIGESTQAASGRSVTFRSRTRWTLTIGEVPRRSASGQRRPSGRVARRHSQRRGHHHGVDDHAPGAGAQRVKPPAGRATYRAHRAPSTDFDSRDFQRPAAIARAARRAGLVTSPMSPASAPVQQTGPEDLRRKRERRLRGRDIDRRQRDQVPEPVDCPLALAMVGEPAAEGDVVERRVVGSRRRERERRPCEPHPLARPRDDGTGPATGPGAAAQAGPTVLIEAREPSGESTGTSSRSCRYTGPPPRCGRENSGRRCSNGGTRAGHCRNRARCAGWTT